MSDPTRKIKNPLLTAAGQGFPFEEYSPESLLVPPAEIIPEHVPEITRDVDNPSESTTNLSAADFQPAQINPELNQFPPSLPDSNLSAAPAGFTGGSGYFTSILSSLPNLSISSITGQVSRSDTSPSQVYSYCTPEAPPNFIPASASPANYAPPPPRPPSPSKTNAPVTSYRLGNQRRLKYAPPPNLTSSAQKPQVQSPFDPPAVGNVIPQNLFQPNYATEAQSNLAYTQSTDNGSNVNSSINFPRQLTPTSFPSQQISYSEPNVEIPTIPVTSTTLGIQQFPSVPATLSNAQLKLSSFPPQPKSYSEPNLEIPLIPTTSITQGIPTFTSSPATLPNTPSSFFTVGQNLYPANTDNLFYSTTEHKHQTINRDENLLATAPSSTFFDTSINEIKPPEIAQKSETIQPTATTPCLDNLSTIPLTQTDSGNIFNENTQTQNLKNGVNPDLFYNPSNYAPSLGLPTNYPISTPLTDEYRPELPQSAFDPQRFPPGSSSFPPIFATTAMPEPTGSATLNPTQISLNPLVGRSPTDTIPPSLQSLAAGPTNKKMTYRPVYYHWFYRREVESKILWHPFSMHDSLSLEDVYNSSEITTETKVATDGGRYDVEILKRQRSPVYWPGEPMEVRRSSWFYKGPSESRYVPYEESVASRLEEEYKQGCSNDHWNRRVELNNGEYIIFHSATIQVHYLPATSPELVASWGNSAGIDSSTYLQGSSSRPKVVKRGVDEFHIDDGEPEKIDHLLFLVHGIGSVCDLKFRTVEEVVDEFRSISLQLVQSHYRTASEHGVVSRIEVLPISWHATLHSDDTGIDKKLRAITLESIPKLRHFTNDTLLDVLFYTSPIFCQTIMQTVGNEMNRLYSLFKERNTGFGGSVYLGGHSLGSLIVFDLLCHQKAPIDNSRDETDAATIEEEENPDEDTVSPIKPMSRSILKRRLSRKVSYVMGAAGTGQPFIIYPHLNFQPKAFFALGSPIGMFVTVRGIDNLGENFKLPTCPAFFNIFHPFDPVAYRVESLVYPEAHKYRPMLIPHHKGRKRMHLELKETMARVGADLKQRVLDSMRSTWNSVYQLAMFHRSDNQTLEQEIDKVVEEQFLNSSRVSERSSTNSINSNKQNNDRFSDDIDDGADVRIGQLNGGRRIDYVLQEAPFEYINEYIFALTSHVCYWESEDTMLLILKEMYGSNGIQADAQMPQQIMSTERIQSPEPFPVAGPSNFSSRSSPLETTSQLGFDPTMPITNKPVGPPPISGFFRKS